MQKEAGLPIPQEVRLFKRIVNCTKGIMPVSMFVIYRTIFIVVGSHKHATMIWDLNRKKQNGQTELATLSAI